MKNIDMIRLMDANRLAYLLGIEGNCQHCAYSEFIYYGEYRIRECIKTEDDCFDGCLKWLDKECEI